MKLVRSKYLRGRHITDFQCTSKSPSWIWKGIQCCKHLLDTGLCFKVGADSGLRVAADPWIPDIPTFKLPADMVLPANIRYVRDLMTDQKLAWNPRLLRDLFGPELCRIIQSIPIDAREQDRLLWMPTSSGEFSVRSTYRANNHARFCMASRLDKKTWSLLWKSKLHERHKMLI